ncbi:MAG: hypothetical protein HY608_06780 [Planctomycetes bacterium]|nr:hypothetical protein [Planctomycetota bacterium]
MRSTDEHRSLVARSRFDGSSGRQGAKVASATLLAIVAALGCDAPGGGPSGRAAGHPAGLRPLENPATRQEAERAVERGLAWMTRNQNQDGSWGTFAVTGPVDLYMGTLAGHDACRIAITALCCDALLTCARPEGSAALARGARCLLRDGPTVGRSDGSEIYCVWTYAYVLRFLAHWIPTLPDGTTREEATALAEEHLRRLLILQTDRGGWGYYDFDVGARRPSGDSANSFTTGTVLVSLRDAQAAGFDVPGAAVRDGLRWLRSIRVPNGTYGYSDGHRFYPHAAINKPRGSAGRMQPCNLALHLWGDDPGAEALGAGIETMLRHNHILEIAMGRPWPHEAYYAQSGYFYFYAHAYAARALALLPPQDRARLVAPMAATITRLQGDDGSWIDYPDYGYHYAYATALALDSLGRMLRLAEWGDESP